MAFSTTSIQPTPSPVAEKPVDNAAAASLLTTLILSVYAAQKSKKAMRKMKRRFLWTAFKLKLKSLLSFTKNKEVSDRTLLLILLAVIVLALLLINVVVGLIVLLFILLLYLLGVFKV